MGRFNKYRKCWDGAFAGVNKGMHLVNIKQNAFYIEISLQHIVNICYFQEMHRQQMGETWYFNILQIEV
jgi:hypothetical protein